MQFEEENEPPDAYTFLLAAGEFDSFASGAFTSARKCGKELMRISQMNGTYRRLPRSFRHDMRSVLGENCDKQVAQKLGELGAQLLRPETLEGLAVQTLRAQCSVLSRFWPIESRALIIHKKAKVPE